MMILITGASGNLGTHLRTHLEGSAHVLRLLVHKTSLPSDCAKNSHVSVIEGDLANPQSLARACDGVDCIIHLAGVLFRPKPERFLPVTNTLYVRNIVDQAIVNGVRRFILVSFPHVEGESTPASPARGAPDGHPLPVHSRTRLAAEQYLLSAGAASGLQPVILRAGVIYGPNVKLLVAARWLMRTHIMAIWREPTWIHLLALPDFLNIMTIAIEKEALSGIYNVCDDRPLLLQDFLDRLAEHWGYRPPPRLPAVFFYRAAAICETIAALLHSPAPLTRDVIAMGMTSAVADTSRMKEELLAELAYPTLDEGMALFQ